MKLHGCRGLLCLHGISVHGGSLMRRILVGFFVGKA